MTKLLAEDPFRTLPDPKYYQGRSAVDLGPSTTRVCGPDARRDRHDLAKAIEDACLTQGRGQGYLRDRFRTTTAIARKRSS